MRSAPASAPPPSASALFLVFTLTTTDMPGRSSPSRATSAGTRMRTGRRCTILVKLPVALSGGSSENTAPDAGEKLSTVPSMACSGSASTRNRDLLARPQPRELGFLEVGVDVDRVERHQARQPLAGLHVVAGLHRAVADHAVDRRADVGERQIALGLGERGLEFVERTDRFLLLALEHVDIGLRADRSRPGRR